MDRAEAGEKELILVSSRMMYRESRRVLVSVHDPDCDRQLQHILQN